MSNTFTKAVLKPGTYRSPDGVIRVTPQRLRHWESQIKRVQQAGYQIPMHWDHASGDELDLLSPIRMDASDKSAEKTVGKLVDFRVAEDGGSAELTVQTLTESAREKAASNAVFVSPVLLSHWQDGYGETYSDVIGSVDLVDYPVDYSQGPFQPVTMSTLRKTCVLRMSAAPSKIYRLSENAKVDDSNFLLDKPATDAAEPNAAPEDELLAEVATSLAKLDVYLPPDTSASNLLERLSVALRDAVPTDDSGLPTSAGKPPTAVDPAIATMSLRVNQLEGKLVDAERGRILIRLNELARTGRCTAAEHDRQKRSIYSTRMSLRRDQSIDSGNIGRWIESREAVPIGACWNASEKLQRMGVRTIDAPKSWKPKYTDPAILELQQQKRQMLQR